MFVINKIPFDSKISKQFLKFFIRMLSKKTAKAKAPKNVKVTFKMY